MVRGDALEHDLPPCADPLDMCICLGKRKLGQAGWGGGAAGGGGLLSPLPLFHCSNIITHDLES